MVGVTPPFQQLVRVEDRSVLFDQCTFNSSIRMGVDLVDQPDPEDVPLTRCFETGLVDDVECVTKRSVELRAFDLVEMTYSAFIEVIKGHGEHVVAADHASFRKPFFGSDFDFRPNPANRSRNRRAGHCGQHRDRGIAGEHADRPPSGRFAKIRPENVVASYHVGAVFAASRAADRTRAASGGWRL